MSSLDGQDDDSDDTDDEGGNLSDASGSYTDTKEYTPSTSATGRTAVVMTPSDAGRSVSCPSVTHGYGTPPEHHGHHAGMYLMNLFGVFASWQHQRSCKDGYMAFDSGHSW